MIASLALAYLFYKQQPENILTYRLENVDLLHGTVENGAVLLQVLLHDVVARRASFADGFHLDLHLRWVSEHP